MCYGSHFSMLNWKDHRDVILITCNYHIALDVLHILVQTPAPAFSILPCATEAGPLWCASLSCLALWLSVGWALVVDWVGGGECGQGIFSQLPVATGWLPHSAEGHSVPRQSCPYTFSVFKEPISLLRWRSCNSSRAIHPLGDDPSFLCPHYL